MGQRQKNWNNCEPYWGGGRPPCCQARLCILHNWKLFIEFSVFSCLLGWKRMQHVHWQILTFFPKLYNQPFLKDTKIYLAKYIIQEKSLELSIQFTHLNRQLGIYYVWWPYSLDKRATPCLICFRCLLIISYYSFMV